MVIVQLLRLGVLLVLAVYSSAQTRQQVVSNDEDPFPKLNFSSPSPLIFHSVFGLLQQWPNTFFEFGHSIAPCTIRRNTNLYHARFDANPPPSPEWFAFDPEMSYAILGTFPNSHMLTYRTVRDVRCLYFDGTSASLMQEGSMDSQNVFIHNSSANVPPTPRFGRPPPENGTHNGTGNWTSPIQPEYDRAHGLCDFIKEKSLGGLGWGYEGIVRMNAGFELMWCNFSSPSARLISHLNVSAPELEGVKPWLLSGSDPKVPSKPPREGSRPHRGFPLMNNPFMFSSGYQWFRAATKTYGFAGGVPGRGEGRIRIDSCGIFTFYDPALEDQEHARVQEERELFNLTSSGRWVGPLDEQDVDDDDRNTALRGLGRRRRGQRLLNVSAADGLYMREVVEDRLRDSLNANGNGACSGIDWVDTTRDIISTYSMDLFTISTMLSNFSNVQHDEVREWLSDVRSTVHTLYMPYYEYPTYTNHTLDLAFNYHAPHSRTALQRCRMQHESPDFDELSASEKLTYLAISDILTAICGILLPMFLSIEHIWLAHFNNASAPLPSASDPVFRELTRTMHRNLQAEEELMAWLGWTDQWTACSPGCELGKICYIPMWPVMGAIFEPGRNETGYSRRDPRDILAALEELLWEPRCVDALQYLS